MAESYTVKFDTAAFKQFAKLQRSEQIRLRPVIAALATDPRPSGCVKLSGGDGWRIRVGDYRIVYVIEDAIRVVTVTRVAHRREVYTRKGRGQ